MQTFSIVQSGWQFSKKGGAGDNLNRGPFIFYKLSAVPHLSVWPQKYVAGSGKERCLAPSPWPSA